MSINSGMKTIIRHFNRSTLLLLHPLALALIIMSDYPMFILISGIVVSYLLRIIVLTAIYHRLFAHHVFEPEDWVPNVGTILGFIIFMPPPQSFYAEHSAHHIYVDTVDDALHPSKSFLIRFLPFLVPKEETTRKEVTQLKFEYKRKYENKNTWSKKFNLEFRMITIILAYTIFYIIDPVLFSIMVVSTSLIHLSAYLLAVLPHNNIDTLGNAYTSNHPVLVYLMWSVDYYHADHHKNPRSLDIGPRPVAQSLKYIIKLLSKS